MIQNNQEKPETDLLQSIVDILGMNKRSVVSLIERHDWVGRTTYNFFPEVFSKFLNELPEAFGALFNLKIHRYWKNPVMAMGRNLSAFLPEDEEFALPIRDFEGDFMAKCLRTEVMVSDETLFTEGKIAGLSQFLCFSIEKEFSFESMAYEKRLVTGWPLYLDLQGSVMGDYCYCHNVEYKLCAIVFHFGNASSGCFGIQYLSDENEWYHHFGHVCKKLGQYRALDKNYFPEMLFYRPLECWSQQLHRNVPDSLKEKIFLMLLVNKRLRLFPRDVLYKIFTFLKF